MLTRRINLTLGLSILGLLLLGIAVFALTTNEPTISESQQEPASADTASDGAGSDVEPTGDEAAEAGDQTPEASVPASSASDGEAIYAQQCASCHGDNGEGGSGGPFDDLDLTLAQVINITANGVPRMPAFRDTLTEDQIEAVSEWTLQFSDR